MSADLLYPHDWRNKSGKPSYTKVPPIETEGAKVSEGPTDFAALVSSTKFLKLFTISLNRSP